MKQQHGEVRHMKTHGMMAEVFLTAFKTMPKKEQNIFLSKIIKDARLREDLIDITIAESRAKDKSRPFSDFLKDIGE
jgi:hypothetical protein